MIKSRLTILKKTLWLPHTLYKVQNATEYVWKRYREKGIRTLKGKKL